jgi:hypothetical protein
MAPAPKDLPETWKQSGGRAHDPAMVVRPAAAIAKDDAKLASQSSSASVRHAFVFGPLVLYYLCLLSLSIIFCLCLFVLVFDLVLVLGLGLGLALRHKNELSHRTRQPSRWL